ncbi:hypothetical protein AAG570_001904 [Ranatra chinensis]|uniref:Uncharacterized protein n=1 Tax=Ranatra chinensis TaxID=642074 RepID=A0ABD0YAP5_9HEMI
MDDLVKDLWVLSYTVEKLKERLDIIRVMKLSPIKPWMLRCTETTLHRTWLNREENRAAMAPLTSSKEYLCQRLDMTDWEAAAFAARHPPVMRVQVSKLKEILDFLMAEGFTQKQIYNTPRILCHSLVTIKHRLDILRERKYEPYTLSVICKSEKNFNEFLLKLTTNSFTPSHGD